jgi:hypothetical protein
MSRGEPPTAGVGHVVYMKLPLLSVESSDRLVAALHRADRKLGVGVGRKGDATRSILLTEEAEEHAARRKATSLLLEALEREGLAHEIANRVDVEHVARRALSPGRPRRVSASERLRYRAVPLPGGGVLRAAHEGPLGNWTVYVDDAEERAWAGRNLLAVLSELFELPHGKKEDWVYGSIRQLAGRETALGTRYACPCCDCFTLDEPPSGTFAICPVCCWEDDNVQFADLDYEGGANKASLRQAREVFRRIGASEARRLGRARPPLREERPY